MTKRGGYLCENPGKNLSDSSYKRGHFGLLDKLRSRSIGVETVSSPLKRLDKSRIRACRTPSDVKSRGGTRCATHSRTSLPEKKKANARMLKEEGSSERGRGQLSRAAIEGKKETEQGV